MDSPRGSVEVDGAFHAVSDVTATVWVEGALRIWSTTRWVDDAGRERTVPSPDDGTAVGAGDASAHASAGIALESRSGTTAVDVPSRTFSVLAPVSPGRVAVRLRSEATLDPREVVGGKPLRNGVWDVMAVTSEDGVETRSGLRHEGAARPAVVGDRPIVAYRNQAGALSLDTSGTLRTVVEDSRPRQADVNLETRPDDAGRSRVTFSVPLDGVHVAPAEGRRRRPTSGTAELVAPVGSIVRRTALKVRRRLGASTAPGRFRLETEGPQAHLTVTASATPGLWQVVLTDGGRRRPAPFVVRIDRGGHAEVEVLPTEQSRAMSAPVERPVVSVVVPVYNASSFVEDAIRSVFAQTLPADRIEIVAVDDGSTDESAAILQELSRHHPRMRVVSRENSGSAAAPRNDGIDLSTGRYLFFLDADDLLAPHALEAMTDVASASGAQVVLGRMRGFGNRVGVPRRVFRRTTLDADMVEHHLITALGPTKLFDADHVGRHGLRFPTGLRNGEDQAFVAEAELTADRIAVLADSDYYLVRGHDDDVAEHQSRTSETIDDKLMKARLLSAVIVRHTEPGPSREALLGRPFGGAALEGVFRKGYLKLDPQDRADLVARVVDEFGHLWTPGLRRRLAAPARPLLELVFRGDPEPLTELVEFAGGNVRHLAVEARDDGLVLDVPRSIGAIVGPEVLHVEAPPIEHLLTSLDVDRAGDITLRGQVEGPDDRPAPTTVHASWRRRGTDDAVPAEVGDLGTRRRADGHDALTFGLRTRPESLPPHGVWDLYLTPLWGTQAGAAVRFGSARTRSVDTDAVVLISVGAVLYGTASHGNLSLDRDGSVHPVEAATLEELRLDEDGRPEAVIALPRPGADVRAYATVDPSGGRDARYRLPWRDVAQGRLAARLPVPFDAIDTEIVLKVSLDGTLLPVVVAQNLSVESPEVLTTATPADAAHGAVAHVARRRPVPDARATAAGPREGSNW
ncbi:glycosyltransferase family A protein [Isoptericola sp. b408]|uniref:glycosyltransferase family A protein n=1 Tax=Isoptericola sp. b408 TaxID=3064653 RepID=UPI002713BCA8|nr:glycosyltransferase family A protein [Isoptericola sp. b408]MDO8152700.1 glycosyltransferase family A protein [Isoptericola sp. b408]